MFFFKRKNKNTEDLESYINTIDQAIIEYKDGVNNYLVGKTDDFNHNLEVLNGFDTEASILRRKIETNLYTQTYLLKASGDIMRLVSSMYHIINLMNESLFQFEIEAPYILPELNEDFTKLTQLSTLTAECVIPLAKAYFYLPETINEKIHRVYFYKKEATTQSQALKRKVFHQMNKLKQSEKIHLRYFALHIENIAVAAEIVADQLAVMSIKQNI
ncbi:MAG: hypothetical protein WC140_05035 [Bacteroidales bacterium]